MGLTINKKKKSKTDKHLERGKKNEANVSNKSRRKIEIDKIKNSNTNIFLGLDISIHAPGFSYIVEHADGSQEFYAFHLTRTEHRDHMFRFVMIKTWIETWIRRLKILYPDYPIYAGIEGYAYGGTSVVHLAEAGSIAKLALTLNRIPYTVIPPPTLKSFLTKNGCADKSQMMQHMAIKTNKTFYDDNEVDALACAFYAKNEIINLIKSE